jgi:hypothetical protein
MLDNEFTSLFFNIILSQTLNIVIMNLSKMILSNTTILIKDKLSDYDFANKFIGNKKNLKIVKANVDITDGKSIIPDLYLKIVNYLKKKKIYKEYKIENKVIRGIIEDKEIILNSEVRIDITNVLYNKKDLESKIEIYTISNNNYHIDKFYQKLSK